MKNEILKVLHDQNPWWQTSSARCARSYRYRRHEFSIIRERMASPTRRARLLLGPRAVGKTVLLQQWIDDLLDGGLPGAQIAYVDFDDPRIPRGVSIEDVRKLVMEAMPLPPTFPRHFIIDEIHRSEDWDRWLRRLVDRTADHYLVTDSASSLVAGARESGQHRFEEITVGYLNFRDFYFLQTEAGFGPPVEWKTKEIDPLQAAQSMEDYLRVGGFPKHVHSKDYREVRRLNRTDIVEKAIHKDLSNLRAADPSLIESIFVALVERSGSEFSAQKWSRGMAEATTRQRITQGLRLLEGTHLLGRLPRYGKSKQRELRTHPKVYAMDPGLVTAFSREADPSQDMGRIVETAVFRHLQDLSAREHAALSFFKSERHRECDFVLELDGSPVLIEVTASRNLGEKAGNLLAVADELRSVRKLICVTRGSSEIRHPVGRGEIHEIPLWSFLDRASRGPLKELLR